jgi:hypothetical protein
LAALHRLVRTRLIVVLESSLVGIVDDDRDLHSVAGVELGEKA